MPILPALCLIALTLSAALAHAAPRVPTDDTEVVERLPPRVAPRALERAAAVTDPQRVAWARALLHAARREGDPRPAGQAIALLQLRAQQPNADAALIVTLADAEQHLHDFASAQTRLESLVQRDPAVAPAWLLLATLHRVQGRYASSDAACQRLLALGWALHGGACGAENDALRGRAASARKRLDALMQQAQPADRAWLLTTLGELEERQGNDRAAEAAFGAALQLASDPYTAVAYADLLLRRGRAGEVRAVLQGLPETDAVLLRRAMADPTDEVGRTAARRLQDRFDQADRQPDARGGHERERALAALHLQRNPADALRWAQRNVQRQREPIDLALLGLAALAAGDMAALQQARQAVRDQGLVDQRLAPWLEAKR